ncbi:MAG: Rieske 2Fe-2S protein [Sphingobacteriaceae bacterium]|jgi:nitrite reductase/ring-hydroxylating ferredoxin subunit/uncharacterized membrane protein|nr:Rieske 2Fe-2S protein [Sphingobacteriaceae bacterium]
MLIGLPIGFFVGTVAFDVLSLFLGKPSFWQTGSHLEAAGIISAVLAAIPGIIDFRYTVPPNSSAKKRAAKHGLLNSSMLIIFTAAYFLRDDLAAGYIVAMEVIGAALMTYSGWLGGTLVHRNQIGVDPRYADAGKWKEAYFDKSSGQIDVASGDELKLNQMKLLHIGEERIVLARTETGYVAFDDWCPHKGGSLAGGSMMCGTVQCPWHGSQFDVSSGALKAGPSKEGIPVYEVVEEGGRVLVRV